MTEATQRQPDLFGRVEPIEAAGLTISEQFQAFHERNPGVFHWLVRRAKRLQRLGFDRYSIKGLFEQLRWSHIKTYGSNFKLNNNYTALYARRIMDTHPELDGFFELRQRRAG